MTRNGFALLAVLWLITVVGAAVGVGLADERLGQRVTQNRVLLARGRWAAEACLAVAEARWSMARGWEGDTLDLGRTTRCRWRFEDPGARVNVNLSSRETLARLFERRGLTPDSSARLAAVITARREGAPFTSVVELLGLAGFPPALLPLLTTDGRGTINLNAAPQAVLLALPAFTQEVVDLVVGRREGGRPVANLDELVGALSPASGAGVLGAYAELSGLLTFGPAEFVLAAEGWVASSGVEPQAAIALMVVPLATRLATVRRRML